MIVRASHDTWPQLASGGQARTGAQVIRLRDGSSVTVRIAIAEDETQLQLFLAGLCLEARRLRFFTGAPNLTHAAHLAASTSAGHHGLVAHDESGALVGHAISIQLDETRAEVAVEVADHLHGCGLGTILIQHLAAAAERRGTRFFVAEVLPENRAMLEVFCDGFDAQVSFHEGADHVQFPTAAWRLARERFQAPTVTS